MKPICYEPKKQITASVTYETEKINRMIQILGKYDTVLDLIHI